MSLSDGIKTAGVDLDLSVVIPVYNEKDNVAQLHKELVGVLAGLVPSFEILFVDDGSNDGTFQELQSIKNSSGSRVRVVRFKKNFGQSAAMAAGFEFARGDIVVTLDADLQNNPDDIPLLLQELAKGYDVVCGWRHDRKDNLSKRFYSRISNWLRRKWSGETVHDSGCSLRVYRRESLEQLELYGEMHRYIPAILSWRGYEVSEVKVSHRPRTHGKTKYNMLRLIKGFLDLLLITFWQRYSLRPMHVFGSSGLLLFATGFVLAAYLTWERIFAGVELSSRPLLLLATLMIVVGIQFLVFGILADILIRLYFGQENRKNYTIKEVLE
ncbi:glycosyltransferase family 2 protein [Chloroflexota bacterium]